MHISRRSFLAGATGLISALSSLDLLTGAPAAAPNDAAVTLLPVNLRGYGTLSAMYRPLHGGASSLTHITCESPMKAHLTQAKYLSDLTRLPGTREDALTVGGHALPIHKTENGVVACYARGNDVLILAADSPDHLQEICAALAPHTLTAADFTAQMQVPMWLDRWDKHGLLIYYGPMTAPASVPFPGYAYDYGSDLQFVKDNETGLVLWTKPNQSSTAEGFNDEQWWSWVQENSRKLGVPIHLNTSNEWPVPWLSNRYRDETQLKMPQFIGGFYDIGWMSGTQGAISWLSEAGEDALLGTFQHTVKRFAGDPNIVGWLEPHAESSHTPSAQFCEYGPVADKSMRQFLQARYGKLSVVSYRWTGDANHYKSWGDIHAPEIAEFAGFGPHAIDLRGTWRVKYVPAPGGKTAATLDQTEWYQPGFDDSAWDELVAPGNDLMIRMPRSPLVYRRTVDVPAKWLANQPQVTLYVWDLSPRPDDEVILYVNGTKIPWQRRTNAQARWAVFDVTKALKAGPNLIALNEPFGIICYRVYMTTTPPKQYPELGPQKNALWADYNAWTLWSRQAQMRRGVEMIRQIDPDRSINFMAPSEDAGPITEICKEYGCVFHDTGGMAGNWGDVNTLMMTGAGLPATAEPGNGAPNVNDFQAFWGRWLTEGLNGVHYFQQLGEIIWNPPVLALFEKNRRMYEAIGKYHVPFAEVAILYSTRNMRLTYFPWDSDLTNRWQRGGYESSFNPAFLLMDFCPRVGISDEALSAALADRYRVVVDTNTTFMNEDVLAGIESYVRAGGVFIARGETGRHGEVEPDAWPISKLTGYAMQKINMYGTGAALQLVPGQNVLSDTELNGARGGGPSFKKAAPGCVDLVLWSDGSTAVGMRPLGKGWIVTFAPAFGGNRPETLMLRQLVSHFGAKNRVPATVAGRPGLRFRHFIGNTGLQDVWILFNDADNAVTTELTFLPGVHPPKLTDIVTEEAIEITRDPAGDTVRGIALGPRQTVMYVSPRTDVAASPLEWVTLQRGWWQGTKTPPAKHLPTPAEQQRFTLDLAEGWAYKRQDSLTEEQAAALAQPGIDDHAWERRNPEIWLTANDHQAKRIILRRRFTVPAHWTNGPIYLNTSGNVNGARTFLDGKPLFDGRKLWDGGIVGGADGLLKPNASHVLTLDVTGNDPLIGAKGPFWLAYVPDPLGRQDLSGQWTSYSSELHAVGPVTLPGKLSKVAFVSRKVVVDRAHAGRNVLIYARNVGGGIYAVLTNGKRIDGGGPYFLMNITPFIHFGEENTIELGVSANEDMTMTEIELRYYDKGFYP